jgi:hypothetical protein
MGCREIGTHAAERGFDFEFAANVFGGPVLLREDRRHHFRLEVEPQ